MVASYCSPENQHIYERTSSCFNKNELLIIAMKYNDAKPTKKIPLKVNKKKITKKALLEHLNARLKVHESQWPDMDFMKVTSKETRDKLQKAFRPQKPKSWYVNDREWLNTYDLLNVMHQYEAHYKTFKFLGVHPIDFAYKTSAASSTCISPQLCNFNLKQFIKAEYNQVGVIFNLDKHNEPGSHWVLLYIALKPHMNNFGCYFIDSNSTDTPKEIVFFMQNVKRQIDNFYGSRVSNRFVVMENRKRFQYKDTECGMFSMYFLIQFLKKHKFEDIINQDIQDDAVHRFRSIYYTSN